eukprot:2212144-Rhodomonas_salina.1
MLASTATSMQNTTVPSLQMSGGAPGISSSPTVQTNTLPVPQQTPAPPPLPPSMAAGALPALNFAPPVHPAMPSKISMTMPEQNANFRAAMNGANSPSKTPVRS